MCCGKRRYQHRARPAVSQASGEADAGKADRGVGRDRNIITIDGIRMPSAPDVVTNDEAGGTAIIFTAG